MLKIIPLIIGIIEIVKRIKMIKSSALTSSDRPGRLIGIGILGVIAIAITKRNNEGARRLASFVIIRSY